MNEFSIEIVYLQNKYKTNLVQLTAHIWIVFTIKLEHIKPKFNHIGNKLKIKIQQI
jgi:hypothetical protein